MILFRAENISQKRIEFTTKMPRKPLKIQENPAFRTNAGFFADGGVREI